MRRTVFLGICALVIAGCLKAKDTAVLQADGSGTMTSTYEIHMEKARELAEAAAMMFGGGGGAPAEGEEGAQPEDMLARNPFATGWFREFAKKTEGYELISGKETTEDGKRTNAVKCKFTTLEAAAKGGAFFASAVTLSKVDKSETIPNGAWKLVLEEEMLSDPAATGGFDMKGVLPMFESQLSKLSIGRTITLPCKILETNGKKSEDGLTVSWTVSYDNILEGRGMKSIVVFENREGLKLKPFKFSPDAMALMPRFMQKPPAEPKPTTPSTGGQGEGKAPPSEGPVKKPAGGIPEAPKK